MAISILPNRRERDLSVWPLAERRTGFRLPSDDNWGTQLWYWSNQWDVEVFDHWYGLFGVNWFHWMRDAGVGLPIPVTGLDLLNLPVAGAAGTDVLPAQSA